MIEKEVGSFRDIPRVVGWLDDGSTFVLTRFVILRLLGFVYLVAFASAYVQAPALIGEHGLAPSAIYLRHLLARDGAIAILTHPSIFWISSADGALRGACLVGMFLALAVTLGVTNAGVMLVLWLLQLSLCHVGQIFWGYGWEIQLCETGVLGALLCPFGMWRPFASAPPTAAIWLLRWLIIRIMLGAGFIKLRGDPCWRDLSCLAYHYETQPNPNPVSWLLNQAPPWFHTGGVLFNHVVEIVVPFFILGPRKVRRVAGGFLVLFQIILIVSGNLSFLNWLTIVPALACFDDDLLKRVVPSRIRKRARGTAVISRVHRRVAGAFAIVAGILSVGPVMNLLSSEQAMNSSFEPFFLVNTYGAFGSVSRTRHEIGIEGTTDETIDESTQWREYALPCKPGDVMRRPCAVSPWHYRLDWQMWFAAMSSYEEEPWIVELVKKMLRGDHSIDPLLASDPFPDAPPRWVRAQLYTYELTKRGDAAWWKRTLAGEYIRPLSKDDPELTAFLREHGLPE